MVNVSHRPMLDIEKVVEHYSEKDGVPVNYVCTSAIGGEARAMDIFYRETPHPEFGNRYFGLYWNTPIGAKGMLMITNADKIEDAEFCMVEVDGQYHYSQHRHDFHSVGDISLDGGRAYFRAVGNLNHPRKNFVVRDGEFVEQLE